jgi:carboxymethylenebutenolidase
MGTMISIELDDGTLSAYRASPQGEVKGGLVLIHEIWGLVDHIKNVADRFAAEGYLVVAPDILTTTGVTPEVGAELFSLVFDEDPEKRSAAQPELRAKLAPLNAPAYAAWAVPALVKVVDYLESQPGVDARIAVTGFCFGGSYSFALAAADARVRAAVPFYGSPPEASDARAITAPVLAFYGETDEKLITGLPEVEATMADGGVRFTAEVYPGTGHAFFNDTNPFTYNAEVAADAWTKTLRFLDASLAE